MKTRTAAYLSVLIATALWGIAGPVIKVTLNQGVPPFAFLTLRFLVAAVLVTPFLIAYLRRHPEKWSHLPRLFLLTVLGTTATLGLVFLGLSRTTALDATLIGETLPVFIIAGGALFLKERVPLPEKLGIGVVTVGLIVTVLQPLLEQGAFAGGNLVGNLLILASNLTWMGFTVLSKEDFRNHSPFLITALSFVFGFLTFLPFALFERPSLLTVSLSPTAIGGVLYMAVFSSLAAYLLYSWGMSKIPVSRAAPLLYLGVFFAVPFAYLWLGERVTTPFLIGALIILAGVALTEYRAPHHPHRRYR